MNLKISLVVKMRLEPVRIEGEGSVQHLLEYYMGKTPGKTGIYYRQWKLEELEPEIAET